MRKRYKHNCWFGTQKGNGTGVKNSISFNTIIAVTATPNNNYCILVSWLLKLKRSKCSSERSRGVLQPRRTTYLFMQRNIDNGTIQVSSSKIFFANKTNPLLQDTILPRREKPRTGTSSVMFVTLNLVEACPDPLHFLACGYTAVAVRSRTPTYYR